MSSIVEDSVPLDMSAHYGFRMNPYDPTPLGISEHDSELFVGRVGEGRALTAFLSSFERGAIFVEGGIGVGKTSFVNVQEFRLFKAGAKHAILPSLHVIQLQTTLSPADFLLSVLSNTLNSMRKLDKHVESQKAFRKLALNVEQSLIQTRSFQASIAGFGAGYGSTATATNPSVMLLPEISRQLDECAELAKDQGYERIVINVNNLDLVPATALTSFLDHVRDLSFTRSPYLWVFIGPLGSRALVERHTRRVSELIRTDPIVLQPLTREEVHLAIDARVKKFSLHKNVLPPISEEVVNILYDASKGEVRYILNRATDLLMKTMLVFPTTRQVTKELAWSMLAEMTQNNIERANLTKTQVEVLSRIALRGAVQAKDFSAMGFNNPQALMRYLTTFYQLTLLDRRKAGRDVVYVPRGDVALAFRSRATGSSMERQ